MTWVSRPFKLENLLCEELHEYYFIYQAPPPSRIKGKAKGLPRPNSREKVEESVGWHRLRTITKGWESEEEEEEEERRRRGRKRGTDDLRRKLQQV